LFGTHTFAGSNNTTTKLSINLVYFQEYNLACPQRSSPLLKFFEGNRNDLGTNYLKMKEFKHFVQKQAG